MLNIEAKNSEARFFMDVGHQCSREKPGFFAKLMASSNNIDNNERSLILVEWAAQR
jgi:hypothetical protein